MSFASLLECIRLHTVKPRSYTWVQLGRNTSGDCQASADTTAADLKKIYETLRTDVDGSSLYITCVMPGDPNGCCVARPGVDGGVHALTCSGVGYCLNGGCDLLDN